MQSARAFGHATTLANNLIFAAWIAFVCGQHAVARGYAVELSAVAGEKGEPYYKAFGPMMEGLAAVGEDGADDAVLVRTAAALDAYRATGATLLSAQVLAYLAKALAKAGRFETPSAAWTTRSRRSPRQRSAGANRTFCGSPARSRSCRRRATSWRRSAISNGRWRLRGTKSEVVALRATTIFARLQRDGEKRVEACALLSAVYRGFAEGHDTRDLTEAAALLGEPAH